MPLSKRLLLATLWIVGALLAFVFAPTAHSGGGNYSFDGGSPRARAEVRSALEASSFPWDVVPVEVTIHIAPGAPPHSRVGEIWLDPRLLASGKFAWGIVQHEYAHQVAFLALGLAQRAHVRRILGGQAWCHEVRGLAHDDHACERFASMLAWSYWPSRHNVERTAVAETGGLDPPAFRRIVRRLLAPVA
jgi:hypothetical protein